MSAVLLLVGVWCAHYAYYRWPDASGQQWASYVGTHALVVVALLLLLPQARRSRLSIVVVGACWWGVIESAQAAVCGVIRWGSIPQADLCTDAIGRWPYALIAACSVASLIVMRGRHG